MAEPAPTGRRATRAANLFDLRRIIGGLFVAWGVLLTVLGLFDSAAEVERAAGVRINLYAGLGMLVVGIVFLVWAFTRPLGTAMAKAEGSDEGGRGTGRDRDRTGGDGHAGA
jgi:hypothetical protein